jgi:hypothetical protein
MKSSLENLETRSLLSEMVIYYMPDIPVQPVYTIRPYIPPVEVRPTYEVRPAYEMPVYEFPVYEPVYEEYIMPTPPMVIYSP